MAVRHFSARSAPQTCIQGASTDKHKDTRTALRNPPTVLPLARFGASHSLLVSGGLRPAAHMRSVAIRPLPLHPSASPTLLCTVLAFVLAGVGTEWKRGWEAGRGVNPRA